MCFSYNHSNKNGTCLYVAKLICKNFVRHVSIQPPYILDNLTSLTQKQYNDMFFDNF